tara:strand:- start:69 stop:578 length:510 start_codon:yes stop_codon:yes gene_type:complete
MSADTDSDENSEEDSDDVCPCERESHSDLGPIADDERIARIVRSIHLNKKGALKINLFSEKDLTQQGGSFNRLNHEDGDSAVARAKKTLEQSNHQYHGLAISTAENVRKLHIDDKRAACVVDSEIKDMPPYDDNPFHGDIWGVDGLPAEDIEQLRNELLALFSVEILRD